MVKESIDAKVLESDVTKAIALLENITEKGKDVGQHLENLQQRVKSKEVNTSKGISFLEMKHQLLLSYLINLVYTLLRKSSGLSIHGDSSLDRLIEIRTVLEKIRPIDQKLKYQIDKLIKLAITGTAEASDPLRLKANPGNLLSKLDDEESESSSEETKGTKPKLYVPPKLAAMHYDGDDSLKDREERMKEKAKKRVLSSSMLKELQQEYYDGPEEVRETRDLHRLTENKKFQERTEYEEDNFVRMSMSKKEKSSSRRMATMSALNTLSQFSDISSLTHDAGFDDQTEEPRKKKQKLSGKKGKHGKGKKKGVKKRRH